MSHLSRRATSEAMGREMRAAGPIAHLRRRVALEQLSQGRRFAQKQASPSSLYGMGPWPRALRRERVVSIACDWRACDMRVASGPQKGASIRKQWSMASSRPE
eukprot:15481359-Alexandrium_andersonii.AAC.1